MPGSQELLVIAVVALLVLGPERLPEVARAAARALAKLRTYSANASRELRGVADLGDIEHEVMELRRELGRTRAELRRTMRETIVPPSRPSLATTPAAPTVSEPVTNGAGASDVVDPVPAPATEAVELADEERSDEERADEVRADGPSTDEAPEGP